MKRKIVVLLSDKDEIRNSLIWAAYTFFGKMENKNVKGLLRSKIVRYS